MAMSDLQQKYDTIVIGGGAVGAATVWHLAKLGQKPLLLERKKFTSGTTWHAAGLVGQMRLTHAMAEMACYAVDYLKLLGSDKNLDVAMGFKQPGSVSVALTDERLHEFQRLADITRQQGVTIEVLEPKIMADRFPYLNMNGVVGGLWTVGDGQVNPIDMTFAMLKSAKMMGATAKEQMKVTDIILEKNQIKAVKVMADGNRAEMMEIACDNLVLCTGMWSRQLAEKIGVVLPLQAAEHFYIVTEPVPNCPKDMPVIRIPDEFAYYKEDAGKILLGAFEPGAKVWGLDGIPEDFEFDTLPEDVEHFEQVLDLAINRFPLLGQAGIKLFFNGPESFTPDVKFHIGAAPNVKGCYLATGFNSTGIQTAPGAGKMIAEWVVQGLPPLDLSGNEIARFQPYSITKEFLKDRTSETLGLLYATHFPNRQFESARGIRRSPFHHVLLEKGAVMAEAGGWERPGFFKGKNNKGEMVDKYHYTWFRPKWHDLAKLEAMATAEHVALYDQTCFHKFLVKGRDALNLLNRLSVSEIDTALLKVVYTQWLHPKGGILSDLTITRLQADEFLVVTGSATGARDYHYLCQAIGANEHVTITDVTAGLPMLGLMGPKSRQLLAKLTKLDLTEFSNKNFPFATSRYMEIGYAPVRVARLTYVGELGYEIYVTADFASYVLEKILAIGAEFQLNMAGYQCLNGCRMEKAYRHFGHDIAWHDNLVEAGLQFTMGRHKTNFIGREPTLQAMAQAEKLGSADKRLVALQFEDKGEQTALCYHEEPIMLMQGKEPMMVGAITSGAWGYRLDRSLGLGYIKNPKGVTAEWLQSAQFGVLIANKIEHVKISTKAFYDPDNKKIKADI